VKKEKIMRWNMVWTSLTVFVSLAILSGGVWANEAVFGVGAAFPKKVYQEWAKQYKTETGTDFIFFTQGSGKGVEAAISGQADFGASDRPLTPDELEKNHLAQFPTMIGGVIPVVNINNIGGGQLQLDGMVLADIYLGKIKRWNDPAIVALNPGLALPKETINVLHRIDKSGATYVLTDYFSKVSAEWKNAIGSGLVVSWKVGEGADSAESMGKQLLSTSNSIGYIDPIQVQQKHLSFVKMRNHAGVFVSPNQASFAAAAKNAAWDVANGYGISLTDQPGQESWPLATTTYAVISRNPKEVRGVVNTLKYFDWSFRTGAAIAQNWGFVSIPAEVMQGARDSWKTQIKDRSGNSLWK
jgi:phosphate transport system substrate-binding protein